jgi:hypothetical protein
VQMIKIPKETIVAKIKEKSGLTDSQLSTRIKDKLDQLSGLISEEGALHIIANELGVKILDEPGELQVKNVLPGMRNIDIKAKIIKVYETREFDKGGKKGKVGNFLVGDQTGVMRVVAWNEKADILGSLKEQDVIKIKGGYARDNQGRTEIHLGDKTEITFEKGTDIEIKPRESVRKQLKDLTDTDDNVEVMGTIVQVFDPRFFMVDKETGKKLTEKDGQFYFNDQPAANPDYSYVTNILLDDGTDNIRVVLWKSQTQKLFSMQHDAIVASKDKGFENIKNDLLGKIVKFSGRINKNEMFQRREFIAGLVFTDPNPEEEIARLNATLKDAPEKKADLDAYPEQDIPSTKEKEEVVEIDLTKGKKAKDDLDIDDIEDLSDLDSI